MSRRSNGVAGAFDGDGGGFVIRHTTAASPAAVLLNEELHSNRIFLMDTIYTTAGLAVRLPRATGTGNKYTVVNNAVQTLSTTVSATSVDTFEGVAIVFSQTVAESGDLFLTTATDDTYTFNITTTGGLRGDWFEAIDMQAGKWLVKVHASGGGTLATGFSAAVS